MARPMARRMVAHLVRGRVRGQAEKGMGKNQKGNRCRAGKWRVDVGVYLLGASRRDSPPLITQTGGIRVCVCIF